MSGGSAGVELMRRMWYPNARRTRRLIEERIGWAWMASRSAMVLIEGVVKERFSWGKGDTVDVPFWGKRA